MATPIVPMTAFVGLNCDVLQIILNIIDSRDCQTQDGLALYTQKPLKALALVKRKLASMVQPRLFTDLSVLCPYNFAVTFVDGPSKPKLTDFAKCARRIDINSTYDFSGSKKLLAGYEVSFNFLNRLTKLQRLRISMLPCFDLTSRQIKQKLLLRICTIAYPTIDCEDALHDSAERLSAQGITRSIRMFSSSLYILALMR